MVAVTALDHQVADVDAEIDALKVRRADLWADRGRILAAAAARAATPADIARVFLTTGERFNDLTAYVQSLHPTFGMPSRFGVERKAFWLAPEIRLFSSLVDLSPQNATALAQALREFAVTCAPDPIVLTDSDDPYWHEHHNGWHAARILGDARFIAGGTDIHYLERQLLEVH